MFGLPNFWESCCVPAHPESIRGIAIPKGALVKHAIGIVRHVEIQLHQDSLKDQLPLLEDISNSIKFDQEQSMGLFYPLLRPVRTNPAPAGKCTFGAWAEWTRRALRELAKKDANRGKIIEQAIVTADRLQSDAATGFVGLTGVEEYFTRWLAFLLESLLVADRF
ncbi:unnamed protein product [Amoebophrya sp. A120]|nr:unnamed protein product [Amoebophrya sp. A120]|eukprot:GSA120T00025080001.1